MTLVDALSENGVELSRMHESQKFLKAIDAKAYLELHIEQGPVLESMNKSTGVVLGTFGVERHLLRFVGQAAHSGSTPIPMRRDAFLAAAESALAFREIAKKYTTPTARVVCTVGTVKVEPGIVTAVPGVCEISLDQRALDAPVLEQMLADAREASSKAARDNNVTVEWKRIWSIEPRPFDAEVDRALRRCRAEVTGDAPRLPSGPAARRRGDGAAHAGGDDVRVFVERPVALQGRGHARAAPAEDDRGVLAAGAENRHLRTVKDKRPDSEEPGLCNLTVSNRRLIGGYST